MSSIKFDISGFEQYIKNFEQFSTGLDNFVRNFLLQQANIALADTKAKTPVKTGDLRNRWELTDVRKIGNDYQIQIFNTLYYASYIEDGHKQRVGRFVPGIIDANGFHYVKGAKSGIVLKRPFINGFHMCRIALTNLDLNMKRQFEMAFKTYRERCKV